MFKKSLFVLTALAVTSFAGFAFADIVPVWPEDQWSTCLRVNKCLIIKADDDSVIFSSSEIFRFANHADAARFTLSLDCSALPSDFNVNVEDNYTFTSDTLGDLIVSQIYHTTSQVYYAEVNALDVDAGEHTIDYTWECRKYNN